MNAWGDNKGKMDLCTFVLIHENNVFPSNDVNEILQKIESTEEQKGDHMMETLGLHCIIEHTQQSSSLVGRDLHIHNRKTVRAYQYYDPRR